MRDRYYEANTCYYMSSKKRRRILKKRIRCACGITIGICMFIMLGIVGSADLNKISIAQFLTYEAITVSVLLTAIYVGGNV